MLPRGHVLKAGNPPGSQATEARARFAVLVLLVGLAYFGFLRLGFLDELSVETLRDTVKGFGPLAPPVYILIYAVEPLTFLPATLLTVTGALLFGPYYGSLYTLVGASLGASLAFWLARLLGRGLVETICGCREKLLKLDKSTGQNGFKAVLVARLIPFVPWDVVNFGSGLAGVRFRDYLLATILGMAPMVIAVNFLSDSIASTHSLTYFTATVLLAVIVIGYAAFYVFRRLPK